MPVLRHWVSVPGLSVCHVSEAPHMCRVQHPDLVEKRRKVFADRISQYIKPDAPNHAFSNGADNGTPRQRAVTRHTT